MKFKQSLLAEGALYTDFYQLTMAQVYFQLGIHEKTSQFDYFFRSYPDYGLHQAGYCINAGMESRGQPPFLKRFSWLADGQECGHRAEHPGNS
jgi:hypothetical protein